MNNKKTYELHDSPFYKLKSKKKLSKIFGFSLVKIQEILEKNKSYKIVWKHKKQNIWKNIQPSSDIIDDYRPINIPDPKLKLLQARIASLLSRISPPDWLFSPVKGRSYVNNAAVHKNSKAFWLLDISNYFPNCTQKKVYYFFRRHLECSSDVAAILADISTNEGCLPQGSPCSPILAYFSNFDMWREIAELVNKNDLLLSVYADDITISGDVVPKKIVWDMKMIIHRHGHTTKKSKELSLIDAPADITGTIVFKNSVRLPNRQMKKIADLRKEKIRETSPKISLQLARQLSGRLAQKKQVESV